MEADFLRDPVFWASDQPGAPGKQLGPDALAVTGIDGLLFFQSSGSTGHPKWIGLSREALLLSASVVNRFLGVSGDDCWGLALPLHHVGGFGVVARSYEGGTRLACWSGRWEAAGFADWLGRHAVTHTSLVPTQVHDLVAAGCAPPPALRAVVVGGGVLDDWIGRAARGLGWPVLASYGMTEAGSQVATQSPEVLGRPYKSSPLPLLPHWDARIGGEGRIELNGPALFSGRLVRRSGSWVFEPREAGWFATSDRGRLAERSVTVIGRIDAVVKILGELVDPTVIERELGLTGCAVVALPDERKGHRLVVACEAAVASSEVEAAVTRHNASCEGFRRIDGAVRLDTLPRGPLGKLMRGELMRQVSRETI